MKVKTNRDWNGVARSYANMAADKNADSYEYEINFPSILKLLPKDKESLLDVGTGSGDFIPQLTNYFSDLEGADASVEMLKIARNKFPDFGFYEWNLENRFSRDKNGVHL